MRIRTGYSFYKAFGKLRDVAAVIPWDYAPISDRNSTFGFNRWTKLVKRPIYGVELAVTVHKGEKLPTFDYWTFFATDDLVPLHNLIGLATSAAGPPQLTYQAAQEAPSLIKITGERTLIDHVEPHPDLYIGMSPSLPKGLYTIGKARGFQFIATGDNVYPTPEDREKYRVMLGPRRSETQSYPQHIMTDDEWLASIWYASPKEKEQAILARDAAAARCVATMRKAELLVPEKPKTLRAMCEEGAAALGCDLSDPIYAARLDKELTLIAKKEYEDYFYIIADIVQYAKRIMVVGPARGSSCGSLVCYLLGITAIDPIPYGLLFERFIDINRKDLPDIDIDFSDVHRDRVFDYIEKKYGRERVARLGTVGLYRPRSALDAIGLSLRIPLWEIEKVSDSILVRSSGDARALQALEDTLQDTEVGRSFKQRYPEAMIATHLEGHPHNQGQHAAGMIVTQDPVVKYVAIDNRTRAVMCDKKDAEDFNLQKIDCLGLTQLSIFERTMELIGKKPVSGWLERIPLDDPAAFEVLNKGQFSGIFQFNGGSLQSLAKQIKTTSLDDIIAITALSRPGPMASGGAQSWVQRKNGVEPVTYPHPLFEPHLSKTMGIVTYQEQVMVIGREIGDLSWEDVTALRQSMSRSLGKEHFNKYGDRWKEGARAKGIPQEVLEKVWDDLCAYGSWSFNHSHAVAYGMVSYWCCYLKAHHPFEFAAATLDAESHPQRQLVLLRELATEGIGYKAVDVEASIDRWVPKVMEDDDSRILVGPLQNVKGIGPAKVIQIMEARQTGKELKPGLQALLESARTPIDDLYPITSAAKRLSNRWPHYIYTTPIKDIHMGMARQQVTVFGTPRRIAPRDENDPQSVAKRKGKLRIGPHWALNIFLYDDTDEILCRIGRFEYAALAPQVISHGRAGNALWAIKGLVADGNFRMIVVQAIKLIGDLDPTFEVPETTYG